MSYYVYMLKSIAKKPVTYVDIIAEDTIDDKIVDALRKKINIASEVLGEELKSWIQQDIRVGAPKF